MIKDNSISNIRAESGKKGGLKNPFAKAKPEAKGQANSEDENEDEDEIDNKIGRRKMKPFVIPSIQEVRIYFEENGYDPDIGESKWHYYNDANWFDSHGNPVLNWKQKMRQVWFKPENLKQIRQLAT
jgi:hypothetical protein